ncbi:hypothetical protein RhiirC2_797736 [Rhizophagus irregularis]|uniref:Retrotransposon gag domain-containing protein n=1 Tax=Rhizophagus irregularis TaxID=588596 RepID=A0A2N1M7J0_9GLOM|nr:hypothetical protein RhiirC2_797736 [Rhizophagus irregularis]
MRLEILIEYKVYCKHKGLVGPISKYQIEESYDELFSDDEENIIKISPNPSSSEESENLSNNTTENNSLNNTLRINISTLGNSTRTNSYDGNQIEKLRKVKPYLKDKAADWLEEINEITNFNGIADNTSLAHQMKREKVGEYAAKFNKLLKRIVLDNNNLHDRFKVNYFIQKLNSIIAERIFEGNPGTLVDAIANIEVGNNLMLQGLGIFNLNINKSSISKLQTATVDNNITNKVDNLAKQLKELKIAKLEKEILSIKNKINNNIQKPQFRPQRYIEENNQDCYYNNEIGLYYYFNYDYQQYKEIQNELCY